MLKAVIALVPSAGVLFLFVVVIRSMLEGDRRERSALAKWEAEHDRARAGGQPSSLAPDVPREQP